MKHPVCTYLVRVRSEKNRGKKKAKKKKKKGLNYTHSFSSSTYPGVRSVENYSEFQINFHLSIFIDDAY